jgi:FlgD Ig-like domain
MTINLFFRLIISLLPGLAFILIGTPTIADSIGGTDVIVVEPSQEELRTATIAIASDGTMYAAASHYSFAYLNTIIEVYRSLDGGATWSVWDRLASSTSGESNSSPSLTVAEGAEDLVFLAYTRAGDVYVGHKAFDGAWGDFEATETVAMSSPDRLYYFPSITTDAVNYNSYYVFVVAESVWGDPAIWFARSTNRGDTFSLNLQLSENTGQADRGGAEIVYGFGGRLHVVWFETPPGTTDIENSEVYYRRGTASGSTIGSWEPAITLAAPEAPGETTYEIGPSIAASTTGNEVLVTFSRFFSENLHYYSKNPGFCASADQGGSFTVQDTLDGGGTNNGPALYLPATDQWRMFASRDSDYTTRTAPCSDPTSWSVPRQVADPTGPSSSIVSKAAAVDPSQGDRFATVWTLLENWPDPDSSLRFDAEAHGDPGYPNLVGGFPVDLAAWPVSAPALADLDGNGDEEIIWGDEDGFIQVYDHDGTSHPGWPQQVTGGLSSSPIAVGDLAGTGNLTVVAGSANGYAWAFDATGTRLWSRQVKRNLADPVYVSIGALGPPHDRYVVMAAGPWVRFAKYSGRLVGGIPVALTANVSHPAAIGDVNGDGTAEYVIAAGLQVLAGNLDAGNPVFDVVLEDSVSAAPVLADLDLDGDVETIVPAQHGVLHALDHTGSPFSANWPLEDMSNNNAPFAGVAVANARGSSEPEIAAALEDWRAYLLNADGTTVSGYPVQAERWDSVNAGPLLAPVTGSADVVMGTTGGDLWTWDNFGSLNTGWPIDVHRVINLTPALGDVDADGLTEIVVLTRGRLLIYDVQEPFDGPPEWYWPMAGHDAQRTGCSDCYEEVVSGLEIGDSPITRVSFARPAPNPLSGPCEFRYSVPGRAAVRLEIYNLRGQRVSEVHREESTPGEHVVFWNGRGNNGGLLSSGTYFAKLTVRGPDLNEQLTRKLVIIR